jgi:hypothetical protein
MRTGPIDNRFDRIFETLRLRHKAVLSQLLDCDYLGFALPGPDDVANRLAEKRPGQRRSVRYRSVRRIGFISPTMPKLCSRPSSRMIVTVFPNWTAAVVPRHSTRGR